MKKKKPNRKKERAARGRLTDRNGKYLRHKKRIEEREQKQAHDRLAEAAFRRHNQSGRKPCRWTAHGDGPSENRMVTGRALKIIGARAPKLIEEPDFDRAIYWLLRNEPIRSLKSWKASGKSSKRRFMSLAKHLFVQYPVPPFVYDALLEASDSRREYGIQMLKVLGSGNSLYSHVRERWPIPLTRKMCHILATCSKQLDLIQAIRRAQILGYGGSEILCRAIAARRPFTECLNSDDEQFWDAVIHWMCRQDELEADSVGPILDWIAAQRGETGFNINGRTLQSTLRSVDAWHMQLAVRRGFVHMDFPASGFRAWSSERMTKQSRHGFKEVRSIREILSAKALLEEGQAMRHCVYSYARNICQGSSSIWTYTWNGNRELTIQVLNASRRVVQIRGKANSLPSKSQLSFVKRWMVENGLQN